MMDNNLNVQNAVRTMMNQDWDTAIRAFNDNNGHYQLVNTAFGNEFFTQFQEVLFCNDCNLYYRWIITMNNNLREFGVHAFFHGALHSIFKIFFTNQGYAKVVSEFQVGGDRREVDMLLTLSGNIKPLVIEFKYCYIENQLNQVIGRAQRQIEGYADRQGFARVTSSNRVVMADVIFKAFQAERVLNPPSTLISACNTVCVIDLNRARGR
ncbi:MAG: hypothetical protein QWI36_04930 [Wolbachia endosymbiont of Tyrophagus putrescentiae]|nr:hypothetical protein [Wolbachia endosymbiont of Tyrophagus putrescentiae]